MVLQYGASIHRSVDLPGHCFLGNARRHKKTPEKTKLRYKQYDFLFTFCLYFVKGPPPSPKASSERCQSLSLRISIPHTFVLSPSLPHRSLFFTFYHCLILLAFVFYIPPPILHRPHLSPPTPTLSSPPTPPSSYFFSYSSFLTHPLFSLFAI